MKVNFLIFDIYGLGGTVRTVLNIANYLVDNGYKVNIISVFRFSDKPSFEIDPRVKVKVLINKHKPKYVGTRGIVKKRMEGVRSSIIHKDDEAYQFFNKFSDLKIKKALKSLDEGILITTRPSFNILAGKYARKDVVVIGQEHLNITIYPEKLRDDIEYSYKKLDYLATLTDGDTKDYREMLKGSHTEVVKLTNSVPKMEYTEIAPLTSKTIIAAGRLVPQKGFDLLIDAFEIIKDRYPDWKVKIYGKGRDKRELQQKIQEKELYNHVLLMGPTNNIEAEFRKSSIFALSSRYEGFGMVIVEAMQCGIPVVSFDCPRGPGEIIEHERDGILVKDGNVMEFAGALSKLMDNYDERVRLSENALESVKKYEIEVIGKEWVSLIEKIKMDKGWI